MTRMLTVRRTLVALCGALLLASGAEARPGDRDDFRSYGIPQTVARVAYVSGHVSYSRGDDPDFWQPASRNVPMTVGDRVYTAGRSRLELQTEEGETYLAPRSELAALDLTYDVKQFSLGTGTASFRLRRLDRDEVFEVDTPGAAVTFDGPGYFRIDVGDDGDMRVTVFRGEAWVAADGGEVPLEAGQQLVLEGGRQPVYDVVSQPRRDSWDRWVESRAGRSRGGGYVHSGIAGVDDLDEYGRWSIVPGYGRCWSPAGVSADWRPYVAGRWVWQDPWGWTWVSDEPWGWAPYHYGRWVVHRSSWYWVPVAPNVTTVSYAPALVAFVGGPDLSLSVSVGGGYGSGSYVGWFPLAPSDPLVPWWGSGARTTSYATATFAHRSRVTMVAERAFVSGEPVARSVVRDPRIAREMSAAPVVRGPLPIAPTESSIRVSRNAAARPPAEVLERAVVTRRAPPPAPARFRQKERLIRENRGAPVAPAEASRLAGEGRAIRPTRSVLVREGRVGLAPKNARGAAPAPATREAPQRRPRREARVTDEREAAGPARAEPSRRERLPASERGQRPVREADRDDRRRSAEVRSHPRAGETARPARPQARGREAVERNRAAERARPAKERRKERSKPPRSEER